jgi:hypothetical protein
MLLHCMQVEPLPALTREFAEGACEAPQGPQVAEGDVASTAEDKEERLRRMQERVNTWKATGAPR